MEIEGTFVHDVKHPADRARKKIPLSRSQERIYNLMLSVSRKS